MKYSRILCSVFCVVLSLELLGCEKEKTENGFFEKVEPEAAGVCEDCGYYYSEEYEYTVTRFGEGLLKPIAFGNYAQGAAIYANTFYQLFNGGYAMAYDFSNETPFLVKSYHLGCCRPDNHAGSCQFWVYEDVADVEKNYLYIASSHTRTCYVEQINRDTSFLVQTITAKVTDLMPDNMLLALQVGDDGHIWGNGRIGTTLYNYKFRKVKLAEGELVTLTDDDLIDDWTVENYDINHYMRQGFKYKYGLLFFLYGNTGSNQHRGIDIYDLRTHEKIRNISLDGFSPDELEGIEVRRNVIYVTTISDYGLKITFND